MPYFVFKCGALAFRYSKNLIIVCFFVVKKMPEPHYFHAAVAVNCCLFAFDGKDLLLLLIQRQQESFCYEVDIPSVLLAEHEELETALGKLLHEVCGVRYPFFRQLQTFGSVQRHPQGRVLSVAYWALMRYTDFSPAASELGQSADWYAIDAIPDLPFDHSDIAKNAVAVLREQLRTQPYAFELLPNEFALPDLQNLYEQLLIADLDKRNFRRKLMYMDFIEETESVRQLGIHRPARLYRFNEQTYRHAVANGFRFSI